MQRPFKVSTFGRTTRTRTCLVGLPVMFLVSLSWSSPLFEPSNLACDNEVTRCVDRYFKSVAHGHDECFGRADPKKRAEQGRCLPLSLGVDARNGKVVKVVYSCSDVCPDYGGIGVAYANTSQKDCCAIGGYPGQRGCTPPEIPPVQGRRAYYPRYPDGPRELAWRSPCAPEKIVFADGTVVVESTLWTE